MNKEQSFDLMGALLTVINATTLLVAITQRSWIWLAIGAASLAAHILYIRNARLPFVNPQVFRTPGFTRLILIGFCVLVVNLGNLFLMPLVLADLYHRSALAIGLLIAPGRSSLPSVPVMSAAGLIVMAICGLC